MKQKSYNLDYQPRKKYNGGRFVAEQDEVSREKCALLKKQREQFLAIMAEKLREQRR